MTTTTTTINGNDQVNVPYARLESAHFGTYDIWQEKVTVGKKSNHHEVDINMGSTSVVSRTHFELILLNGTDFQLRCLSKNGIFVNNNYLKNSSISILPKQCTLRFPSTDICISFSSLINNANSNPNSLARTPPENVSRHLSTDTISQATRLPTYPIETTNTSLPIQSTTNSNQQQQQVILVTVNHEINNNNLSSLNANRTNGQIKNQFENSISVVNNLINSSIPTSPKAIHSDMNENPTLVSSPVIQRLPATGLDVNMHDQDSSNNMNSKNSTKPPFSYAQLIVQAILSAPDKQMTLSQIYNFISAQYPYYEANNRGWQNSIRHNLSLNRYFIRLARKENDSGKGSFWRLDETCEEKLIDHAFRHRKQRGNSISLTNSNSENNHLNKSDDQHSPTTNQYSTDQNDFLLADLHTSNPSTPLSPMTSPLTVPISPPTQQIEDNKRKRDADEEDTEIEQQISNLLNDLTESIDERFKRQKLESST